MKKQIVTLVFIAAAVTGAAQLNIQPEIKYLVEANPSMPASIAYPLFKGDTPVVEFANLTLKARAERLISEFRKAAKVNGRGEAKTTASISFYTTELITGVMTSYAFTGGAHGMTFFLPYNFASVNGKPKELKFVDVFKPGTREQVSDRILAKLAGVERALWVANGQVTRIDASQLDRFVIGKLGVKFMFDRYELGPYSSGDFTVTLLWSEIEDVLLPGGPAKFARAAQ